MLAPAGTDNLVAFSPDNRTVATGGADGTIRLWDAVTQGQRRIGGPLTGHTGWAYDVESAPDGRSLASVSLDGIIQQWSNYSFEEYRDQLCRMIDKQQAASQWAGRAGRRVPRHLLRPSGLGAGR